MSLQNSTRQTLVRFALAGIVASTAVIAQAAPPTNSPHAATSKSTKPAVALPDWKKLNEIADAYFAKLPEYRSGDLLSRGQVKPLLAQFTKVGWTPSDADDVLASLSEDNDFVVRQLQTKDGRKFMRKIAGTTQGYDRLQRLAATEGGDRAVRDMMKLPNGNEVLASLTEQKNGRDASRRLANGPRTGGFDEPTGRIYTQADIVARLKQSYDRDAAAKPGTPNQRGAKQTSR